MIVMPKKVNFQILSPINSKHVLSYRAFDSDSFGIKHKVIGQVEQELWLFKEFISLFSENEGI